MLFCAGSSTKGEKPGKNKKSKKKKSSKKNQAAGEWQGQEGEGIGKNSISSALEDDSGTGSSGGIKVEAADNRNEEKSSANSPALQEVCVPCLPIGRTPQLDCTSY